jgi:CRP-like cAMP-binding protein/predicted MFS family arabinose efflux permease
MAAFTTSAIGSWAYNVALAVWLLDETGEPGWIAASTVGRFVPALLMSAYGGVIAERFERVRLMRTIDLSLFAVMLLLAGEMALHAHPAIVVATAGISSAAGSIYEPAAAAMTPQLVPERALGSANALRNTVDNICVIAGPGLGALMLLVAEPSVVLVFNAVTFTASAAFLSPIKARSVPVDVTEGGEAGPVHQMLVGIQTITASPSTATLVAFSIGATFVFGVDTVMFPVISRDVLGTGAEGYGYLLAGLGAGGIAAAGLVPRLERLPRLGTVILLGMAAYCLPTLAFLVTHSPVIGFMAQVVRGAGTLVVDVLAVTALQRSVPPDRLARVFGAFDSLMLLAILVGSCLVPVSLSALGIDATLWLAGLGFPLLCLLGLPWLRRMDREALTRRAALAPKVSALGRCDLFASVREGSLEQLAGSAESQEVAPDAVVVQEGTPADAFYVVESGTYAASTVGPDGKPLALQELGEGDYFGEIGLIEAIPRTATVTAVTAGRLLRVDGAAFVEALTQAAPSTALVDGAAQRLRRTHPTRSLTRAGLVGE